MITKLAATLAWGGRSVETDTPGIQGTIGYTNLLGLIPIPSAGVRIGGDHSTGIKFLAPGMVGFDSGRSSSFKERKTPRGLPDFILEKIEDMRANKKLNDSTILSKTASDLGLKRILRNKNNRSQEHNFMITKTANSLMTPTVPDEQGSSIPKEISKMLAATGTGVLGARAIHAAHDAAPILKGYYDHSKLKGNLQNHIKDQGKKYVGLLKDMKDARKNPAKKSFMEAIGRPLLKVEFANKVRNERLVGKEQLSKIMDKITNDKSKFQSSAARRARAGSGVLGGYAGLGLYGLSKLYPGRKADDA